MRLQFMVAALTVLGSAVPAAAQEHPLFRPTRDVTVDYHETGNATPGATDHTMKMYFSAGGDRMRVELTGRPAVMIVDRAAGKSVMLMVAQQKYIEMPYDAKRAMVFDHPEGTLTRKGTDTVAGLQCTVYDAHGPHGEAEICLTADGVMLRAANMDPSEHGHRLEAVKVTYGTLSDSLFKPPAGYQKLNMPAGMGMPPTGMPGGGMPGGGMPGGMPAR